MSSSRRDIEAALFLLEWSGFRSLAENMLPALATPVASQKTHLNKYLVHVEAMVQNKMQKEKDR